MLFGQDNLGVKKSLSVDKKEYQYFSINEAEKKLKTNLNRMPFSLKVILENLLRFEDGRIVTTNDIKACVNWLKNQKTNHEIAYTPARVLMQDFTGVPAVVDLAAMRDAIINLGGDPIKINPLSPVDLVIDHSVQADKSGSSAAFKENVNIEMKRNFERYEFLRWGQKAFSNFRVVPPGTGICHQVNLEYLSQVVWIKDNYIYPDTLVGTDSHTTMVNGLSVLGWGVGGIEAEAVMLGQPMSMLIPEVIGVKLTGRMKEGTTATDLVLTITQMLRSKGVVGKFVEFYGPGLDHLPLADRATIANMAPEYGATCGFFPVDKETIRYLELSARDPHRIKLVEEYSKKQGLWRDTNTIDPIFSDSIELDLGSISPSIAGPRRPQDRVLLSEGAESFIKELPNMTKSNKSLDRECTVTGKNYKLANGDVVIAAITSCTNTSNPSVMLAAGLVAKKASELGLNSKPWVKTTLAPGSKVVTEYLETSGLQKYLDKIGFNLIGYGCTTCIGNSGPLQKEIEDSITKNDLVAVSVLSGNRNFEGRIHPLVKASYLASPPLVVAYALAGSMQIDLTKDVLGKDKDGKDVYLKDIWPSNHEIQEVMEMSVKSRMFESEYANVFTGDAEWQKIQVDKGVNFSWKEKSTYVTNPPYFNNMSKDPSKLSDINGAKLLALFGDSITTDHISPAGNIAKNSPAGQYLINRGVEPQDFNSYGTRRGHHEVMMRGTFANIRIKNLLAPDTEGGVTRYLPTNEVMSIYDAAMKYKKDNRSLIIMAGKEYGTGSSRDWAAKGTLLLGVKAVIAESFERIHRSNLVLMGVLPLMFKNGMTHKDLKLDGSEEFDIKGICGNITPKMDVTCQIKRKDGSSDKITLQCRIDTANEIDYINHGGILQYVIRGLL
ncbi:MAG: aconitate hydratase AcnA [Rickettsiales bacterium]|jgi:aconitate hydratase|nr:aconitate hydratase AcnA [Rickettsiales bacterium]